MSISTDSKQRNSDDADSIFAEWDGSPQAIGGSAHKSDAVTKSRTPPQRKQRHAKPPTSRPLPTRRNKKNLLYDNVMRVAGIAAVLFAAALLYQSVASGTRTPTTFATKRVSKTGRIEDARLGERVVGRNPLRGQVDLVEPEPATWRAISLHMVKPSGKNLWIELLRPLDWLEDHQAQVGAKIYLDLTEMGAVGDAEVLAIAPCPEIQEGSGAVITGKFKHEADTSNRVVHLTIEDEAKPVGVTDNHPYWSVDRHAFVPVGQLRIGEFVYTEAGPKRIVAVVPVQHSGLLYNLETTEHVFRVGSLGTLVHNSCAT